VIKSSRSIRGMKKINASLSRPCKIAMLSVIDTQVNAGVPIDKVITNFYGRLVKRNRFRSDMPAIKKIIAGILGGKSISDVLRPSFSETEYFIFSAGERSGNISEACQQISELDAQGSRISSSLKSAMMVPLVYILSLYVTLYVISTQVVPSLAGILPPDQWMGLAGFIYQSTILIEPAFFVPVIILVVSVILMFRFILPRWTGLSRLKAEKYIPGLSLYRDLMGTLWIGSFSFLLRSGVPDTVILEMQFMQSRDSNAWLSERLRGLLVMMVNGVSFADAALKAGPKGAGKDVGFDFPSPDIVDDIASFSGFPDFSGKMLIMRKVWLSNIEKKITSVSNAFSVAIQAVIYIYFAVFTLAVNQLSTQLGGAS